GQGGSTRSAAATRTSIASARQKRDLSVPSVIRATTRSPGRVCRTSTTRPSWWATHHPPWATRSTSTVTCVPTMVRGSASLIRITTMAPRRNRDLGARAAHRAGALQLPRHRGHHHARSEQQPGLEPLSHVVVQEVLPPVAHHILRNVDGHHIARAGS